MCSSAVDNQSISACNLDFPQKEGFVWIWLKGVNENIPPDELRWKRMWITANKYLIKIFENNNNIQKPLRVFDCVDIFETQIEKDPSFTPRGDSIKFFSVRFRSKNLIMLLGYYDENEKTEWLQHLLLCNQLLSKKVNQLREKFKLERSKSTTQDSNANSTTPSSNNINSSSNKSNSDNSNSNTTIGNENGITSSNVSHISSSENIGLGRTQRSIRNYKSNSDLKNSLLYNTTGNTSSN